MSETGWLPISTAPKDGTRILLFPHGQTAHWDEGAEDWLVMNIPLDPDTQRITPLEPKTRPQMWFEWMAGNIGVGATHWQPLPPPPGGE